MDVRKRVGEKGRNEGRKKGREQGRKQGRKEDAHTFGVRPCREAR